MYPSEKPVGNKSLVLLLQTAITKATVGTTPANSGNKNY